MHRPLLQMFLFFAILLLIIGGSHYYLWVRLVRATELPRAWTILFSVLIPCLALLMPAGLLLGRLTDAPWARLVAMTSYIWMGTAFLLLLGVAAGDLLHRGALWSSAATDPERRLLLARMFGGTAAVAALASGAVALRSGLRAPALFRQEIHLRRLPKGLDGLTIVQISDLHVGPTIRRQDVAALVQRCNDLKPDLIAITGDLVDGDVDHLSSQVAPLADLRAKFGVYFVTGNHEYYSGVDQWLTELRRLGIRTLRNERVRIGQGENSFDLAGVDDWTAHQFGGGHGANLPQAVAGRQAGDCLVLLAHQPKQVTEAAQLGVDLQLSGHTHGGQIWPFTFLVRLAQPYIAGLDQLGPTTIYVSRGTGYWGPPMRLAAPSELTLLTLRHTESLT